MATTTNDKSQKKLEYTRVKFDVNEIAPDAPAGEWRASIPRGKCKVQPTNEGRFPMIIVPIRLDSTEEDGDAFQTALGTELSTFLVFGGNTQRGINLSKMRIREICEALDIDLDIIPKDIGDADDLVPLVRALEGKKFTVWTFLKVRKDTGEVNAEVRFRDPTKALKAAADNDDDEGGNEDDEDEDKPARGKRKPAASRSSNGKGKSSRN